MERDLDALDSRLEAEGLGQNSLQEEFATLERNASVDKELEELKASLKQGEA